MKKLKIILVVSLLCLITSTTLAQKNKAQENAKHGQFTLPGSNPVGNPYSVLNQAISPAKLNEEVLKIKELL
jgi:maltose-binding protein MalE